MKQPNRIFVVGHMGAGKFIFTEALNFLEKQHRERDAFYEEVATVIVESVGASDDASECNKIVETDVNQVMQAIGK